MQKYNLLDCLIGFYLPTLPLQHFYLKHLKVNEMEYFFFFKLSFSSSAFPGFQELDPRSANKHKKIQEIAHGQTFLTFYS